MPEKARPRPGVAGSAGRVIAGVARGRRLVAPGHGARPLGDRVKQSLFAIIEPDLRAGAFLDLFAGSGAAGIEALSRGATSAAFVERNHDVAQYIERNLRTTSLLGPRARIVIADAVTWLRGVGPARTGAPFEAIVLDPPYDEPHLLERPLEVIGEAGPGVILSPEGVAVAKHARQVDPPTRIRLLRSVRQERFGETTLTFYRWSTPDDDAGGDEEA
ncbi:MAG TPA: 16S rRNA (guanine(966)-N(2))-methyltransferase RsmD [Candidatus Binatia bacterium]|nr:16S rRNA (guanine(966)-N(2))-methyltransferase RsmD [Candidatus Binatia bacterium]